MDRKFAEQWLNNLKEYWFNKDIEKAVSLLQKQLFIKKLRLMSHIQHLMKLKRNGNI